MHYANLQAGQIIAFEGVLFKAKLHVLKKIASTLKVGKGNPKGKSILFFKVNGDTFSGDNFAKNVIVPFVSRDQF